MHAILFMRLTPIAPLTLKRLPKLTVAERIVTIDNKTAIAVMQKMLQKHLTTPQAAKEHFLQRKYRLLKRQPLKRL